MISLSEMAIVPKSDDFINKLYECLSNNDYGLYDQIKIDNYIINWCYFTIGECIQLDNVGNVVDGFVYRKMSDLYNGKSFTELLNQI
jgi:hypothetical protein